ncbi:MAG: hypothetical protein ACLQU2_33905 [Candidatus Binataceae bacterium]
MATKLTLCPPAIRTLPFRSNVALDWAHSLGIIGRDAVALKKLRQLPAHKLVEGISVQETLKILATGKTPPGMAMSIIDGRFLPEPPERQHRLPVPYKQFVAIAAAEELEALIDLSPVGLKPDWPLQIQRPRCDHPSAASRALAPAQSVVTNPGSSPSPVAGCGVAVGLGLGVAVAVGVGTITISGPEFPPQALNHAPATSAKATSKNRFI